MTASFRYFILLSGFLMLIGTSCKSSQKAGESLVLKKKSSRFLSKKVKQNQVDVEWFSAKAKVNYKDPNQSMKITATIRLRKDSVLWMNFKKLSIEGARVLITPDSIYIVNRLDKEYAIVGFDFLERRFQMPSMLDEETGETVSGFYSLQHLLLGNAPIAPDKNYSATIEDQQYVLSQQFQGFDVQYWLEGLTHSVEAMVFKDRGFDRTFNIRQSDFQEKEETEKFSYIRNLELQSPETGDISIKVKFYKVELNSPKRIRFEIPSHYQKIQ